MANLIPEELDALIQQYLTDGVLTTKEREVVLRKAEALGLDRDEIDLYLDAEVQKLEQAADAVVRRQRSKSCPYCGNPIPELTDKCPHCGQFVTPEASAELNEIVDKLEDALVDLKSNRDFARSKATVERYSRKAKMYFSNHPKVQALLAEVEVEMERAEKSIKAAERSKEIKSTASTILTNKWVWIAVIIIIFVLGLCEVFGTGFQQVCIVLLMASPFIGGFYLVAKSNGSNDKNKSDD